MAKTRRARIGAENGHRRVTRPRLRIIDAEAQGYPTVYLRVPSDTIEYDHGSRKVGCGEANTQAVTVTGRIILRHDLT